MDDKQTSLQEQLHRSFPEQPKTTAVVPVADAVMQPAVAVPSITVPSLPIGDDAGRSQKQAKFYIYAIVSLAVLLLGLAAYSFHKSLTTPLPADKPANTTTPVQNTTVPNAGSGSSAQAANGTSNEINQDVQSCSNPVTAITSC